VALLQTLTELLEAHRSAALHDPVAIASAEYDLGATLVMAGRPGEARARLERARAVYVDHGETTLAALADMALARALTQLGRYAAARDLAWRAARAFADLGNEELELEALAGSADVDRAVGDYEQALPALRA
jgi:tetratricopeptide (TPR) repeat protein